MTDGGVDASVVVIDGGVETIDGGIVVTDGGIATIDGGVATIDGGVATIDGGVATIDAGLPDAGNRCDDGQQNGSEQGVDCGGTCAPCACRLYVAGPKRYWICPILATWAQARYTCTAFAGDLASIGSAPERDFVRGALDDAYQVGLIPEPTGWIGGSDQIVEGSWGWSDGTVTAYTNWASGEPNNGAGSGVPENCMTMCTQLGVSSGHCGAVGWGDSRCDTTYNVFVCEQ